MADSRLVTLSDEQIKDGKVNIAALERIVKNGDALIDAGAITKDELKQATETLELARKVIATYSPKK